MGSMGDTAQQPLHKNPTLLKSRGIHLHEGRTCNRNAVYRDHRKQVLFVIGLQLQLSSTLLLRVSFDKIKFLL